MKYGGLIIRRSAVQVRLPLPKIPYISQCYEKPSGVLWRSTGREQSEHNERRAAQKSAQPVPRTFNANVSTFPYNSPHPLPHRDVGGGE
jgi:hypothetical protein